MLSRELQDAVIQWTVRHSGHIARRGCIGLSQIAESETILYRSYFDNDYREIEEHLKFRLSFELEEKLIERLGNMGLYSPGEEISLYNGLVQGHTDGVIEKRDILEIKTVPLQSHLPHNGRVSAKIFWQVQGYMHFLERRWTHVLYLARESGLIRVVGVGYDRKVGAQIQEKVERVVAAVVEGAEPAEINQTDNGSLTRADN